MNYTIKNENRLNIDIRFSEFCNHTDSIEYYIVFTSLNNNDTFEEQLKTIEKSYNKIIEQLDLKTNSCISKRFFVSDLLNQVDILNQIGFSSKTKKSEPCAISFIEQPPLSSGKVVLISYHIKDKLTQLLQNNFTDLILSRNSYQHIYSMGLSNIEFEDSYNQTKNIFDSYEKMLNKLSATVKDNVVRTWLYVQNVDANYDGVVEGRKEFFDKKGLTEKTHFIASTGIEGKGENAKNKMFMDSYAIKGLKENQIKYLSAPNHLNPTHEYGVTFERGTSIEFGDRQHVYISGTASIDNKGEIVHYGNVLKQCDRVLENIIALLLNVETSLADTALMIIYLRDYHDYTSVKNHLQKLIPDIPNVIVHAPVCRPGWLIEIECVAIKNINNSEYANF